MSEIKEVPAKYLQIAGFLRDQIIRGDLQPGAEVPSERRLAELYGVARPTASRALEVLRRERLVEARQGAGTFVRSPNAAPRARERLERAVELGSMYSDSEDCTFPFVGIVDGPGYVTEALNLPAGSRVVRRQRIINNPTGPVEFSTSWFPAALADVAPRLLETERVGGGTLGYLARSTDIQPTYARDQVCARLGTAEEVAALHLPETSAVLVYWLVACDSNDVPLEFDEGIYPPERFAFRQEFPVTL
ncbi:GntR family transcriptional regulator [Nocardia sp. CA2R105]|uniref:GntR family transcriptional regulator n=1 Tax=Nocardia coffeae TaxID=2873381 RepID=UPI001CA76E07|nr:GntR family transcriptional regulator [Nocardia coffeae]MBY8856060.1 GntR family transcriptional regulator [Nocardia coffeae]